MTVFVCDLSNNNATPDFGAMKAGGVSGVILKASEGTGFIDPTYAPRYTQAVSHGLAVGAYHFAHPDQSSAQQAAEFVRAIGGTSPAFRCCDIEVGGGAGIESFVEQFCVLAGIKLLYSGAWYASANIPQPIPGVEWWIAAYGSTQPKPPWGVEAGWQFTQSASVPGVPGACDESIFDPAAWAALTSTGGRSMFVDVLVLSSFTFQANGRLPFYGITSNGSVYSFNGAPFHGALPAGPKGLGVVRNDVVGIVAHPTSPGGYVALCADGASYAFAGNA